MKLALLVPLLAFVQASGAGAQATSAYKQQFASEFASSCQGEFEKSLKMSPDQARKTCQCVANELVATHDDAWLHELATAEPMPEAIGVEVDRITDMCMAR